MKIKKIALVLATLFICFAVVSCKPKNSGTYKIAYELEGGTLPSSAPTTYDNKTGLSTLPTPTKEDYEFVGWYESGDSNKVIIKSIDPKTGKDVTLKASWRQVAFKLTFDLNGGKVNGSLPTKYNSKVDTTLPTATKEGSTFLGWKVDGTNDVIKTITRSTRNGDLKLIAQFREGGSSNTYVIQYVLDGGTNPDGAPVEYVAGEGLPALPTPTKDGFEFVGWFNPEGKLVTIIAADAEGDIQLTAKWAEASEKHNITYHLDEGTWPEGYNAPTAFYSSFGLSLADLATPTKNINDKVWNFAGWELNGVKADEIPVGTTEDVVLTATWALPTEDVYYNITYICEGGVLPDDAQTSYKYGVGYILPEPTPSVEGQSFLGWYTETGKIERITAQHAGDITITASFGVKGVYKPLWPLNQIEFAGNGMDFAIKVNPVVDYDPNNPDYTGSNRDIKQDHQAKVEAAYDINIIWSNWEDSAPWGPERVKFINKKYLADDFGDAYVLSIASQWIPTLVKGGSIAELYDLNTEAGIFAGLSYEVDKQDVPGYIQDPTTNEAASVKGKVYGYAPGVARPDYFMYYNVDLVKECGVEDPAEMWLKGEWTLSNFDTWVKTAQNTLGTKGGQVLDMGFAESIIGMVASTGNQMTKVNPPLINMTRKTVTDTIERLQSYYASGYYYGRSVQDVSPGFQSGITLLHHGDLWFLKSSDRFNPAQMTFKIGVVPYPTADGEGGNAVLSNNQEDGIFLEDKNEYLTMNGQYVTTVDMSESSFKIPYTGTSCYAVLNVNGSQSKNGITPTVITHIFHDLHAGIGPDPNVLVNLTEDESYRAYLRTRFDREIDVEVIMSCQGTTYFELMELLSMTVGGGSHFGPNAWWPLAASLVKSSDAPSTKLLEVLDIYKDAMKELGYNVK